ncbi:TPA: hypothetical protein ACTYZB_004839 [Klebsiella variicola]
MYSTTDELDRKVSETLVDIIKKQTGGVMATNEARASIHAVFCSVMGLVSADVSELLEEAMNAIEKERPSPFPVFLQTTAGIYVAVSPDTFLRAVTVRILGKEYGSKTYDCESGEGTIRKALEIVKKLIEQGAKRL